MQRRRPWTAGLRRGHAQSFPCFIRDANSTSPPVDHQYEVRQTSKSLRAFPILFPSRFIVNSTAPTLYDTLKHLLTGKSKRVGVRVMSSLSLSALPTIGLAQAILYCHPTNVTHPLLLADVSGSD